MTTEAVRHRYQIARAVFIVVLSVVLFSILALTLFLTVETRDAQFDRLETQDLLVDCVTPEGQCAQRLARRQAASDANVNAATLAAVVCSRDTRIGPKDFERLSKCVEALTAEKVLP